MRGLLLKEFYLTIKTQWTFLFISVIMLAFSFDTKNPFFLLYPAVLCGMIPSNLMSFDERMKWHVFSDAFPYSRKQAVSSKYLLGLTISFGYILIVFIVQTIFFLTIGSVDFAHVLNCISWMPVILLLPQSVTLPAMFKFGAEKGRIAVYSVLGIMCGAFILLGFMEVPLTNFTSEWLTLISILLSAVVFALSWLSSIKIFEKRDF